MDETIMYYSAGQVKEILGIAGWELKNSVDLGELKRYPIPGKKRLYYLKTEVDELAKKRKRYMKASS